jgi:hypothetical protein
MKSMKFTGIAAAAAMVCSGAAVADPDRPDWTYGQVAYSQGSTNSGNPGGNGSGNNDAIAATLSISGWDYVHLQAEYEDGSIPIQTNNSGDTDFDQYRITLGVHPSIGNETDLLFNIYVGNADADVSGVNVNNTDSDLWGLSGGFRHMVTQRFEVNGKVNYEDIDNSLLTGANSGSFDNVYGSIGGQFNWNAFSGGLEYTIDDPIRGSDVVELNFRYSFADFF